MKKIIASLAIVSVTGLMAAGTPASYGKCVGCHGANGQNVALGKSKIIKDMTKDEIITALNGYKDGTYGGPMKSIMLGQVKSLSGDDIAAIAEYIGK
jgi:cytochrome c553